MTLKRRLKRALVRAGVYYQVNAIRQLPAIASWIRAGCTGVAPSVVKMQIIRAYVQRFGVQWFVETGTYRGDTLGYIAQTGIPCTSIELSRALYEEACDRFRDAPHVTLIHGDSAEHLPAIVRSLTAPALFWLDGHWSCGETALGPKNTPITDELRAILAHPIRHVILIDDARLFEGQWDYPALDEVLAIVRNDGRYHAEVSADIIRIEPKTAS